MSPELTIFIERELSLGAEVNLLIMLGYLSLLLSISCQVPVDANSPVKVSAVSSSQCTLHEDYVQLSTNISRIISNSAELPSDACKCSSGSDVTWTRVAFLNMTDSSHSCPNAWAPVNSPVRACGRRPLNNASCSSAVYSTHGISYTGVCGRVKGYPYGTPNAFEQFLEEDSTVESWYVDGVSLTHGPPGSRRHVWTFANAWYESAPNESICPCMLANPSAWPYSVPEFVGIDYFCSTGEETESPTFKFIEGNPLWDGKGCTGSNSCCQFNQPPWFCRSLPAATTDDLEVRICGNQFASNESTFISDMEIYVK